MTKREGAVISAYTGVFVCKEFGDIHAYIEEIMGRPVWTHEIPGLQEEIKQRSEKEFKEIIENQEGGTV